MEIDVIACGESALNYTNRGNITIGVNDSPKIYPVDYLVCVDKPERFTRERLETIIQSTPKKFYTFLEEWREIKKEYTPIKLAKGSGVLGNINDFSTVEYSSNSAFVACVIAYQMGAKVIIVYGADFNNHPNFTDKPKKAKVFRDYKNLKEILKLNGCSIRVTKESALSEILDVM